MKIKVQLALVLSLFAALIFAPLAMAQTDSTTPTPSESTPIQQSRNPNDCSSDSGDISGENCGVIRLLNMVFNFVSGGIALAVIGNIIFGGIQYSMAQGDPSKASKAKDRIRNAIIAFIMYLVLSAFIEWLIPGGVF